MNMKKILASAAASIVAVSAMSVAASAATLDLKVVSPDEGGKVNDPVLFADQFAAVDDLSKVAKIEIDLSCDSGYFNGFMGCNNDDGDWGDTGQIEVKDTEKTTWTLETDGVEEDTFKLEVWWLNPMYNDAGEVSGPGTVTFYEIRIMDAAGNDLTAGGGATETPDTTETPDNTSTETPDTTSTETKPNTDTGVEGVAAVLGVAVVAAGAMVVAKKRK